MTLYEGVLPTGDLLGIKSLSTAVFTQFVLAEAGSFITTASFIFVA